MLAVEQTERTEQTALKTPTILVIGIGNDYRMDDAAGLLVARKLEQQVGQRSGEMNVHILECTGGGLELIELWTGVDHVVLVDAVFSGTDPGTIFHLDAHSHTIPSSLFHVSTHGFNLADTIQLAGLLGKLPARLRIFGIEGQNFGHGQGLSDDVAVAVEHIVQSLLCYLDCESKSDERQFSGESYYA